MSYYNFFHNVFKSHLLHMHLRKGLRKNGNNPATQLISLFQVVELAHLDRLLTPVEKLYCLKTIFVSILQLELSTLSHMQTYFDTSAAQDRRHL